MKKVSLKLEACEMTADELLKHRTKEQAIACVQSMLRQMEESLNDSDIPAAKIRMEKILEELKLSPSAPEQRIVTRIPLAELWDENGTVASERIRSLDENTLVDLVRSGSVQFVVADCGLKLDWIPREKRFDFWQSVRPQIADPA